MTTQQIERERRSGCLPRPGGLQHALLSSWGKTNQLSNSADTAAYIRTRRATIKAPRCSGLIPAQRGLARHIFTDALGPEATSDDCMAEVSQTDDLMPSRVRLDTVCGLSVSSYARLTCIPARYPMRQREAVTDLPPSSLLPRAQSPRSRCSAASQTRPARDAARISAALCVRWCGLCW